jgi:hypothetical protein
VAKKRTTRSEWLERVQAWKASGLSAQEFARGKGFTSKVLRWWRWKLGSEAGAVSTKPVRVAKATSPIEFIELVTPTRDPSGLLIRVGRVNVEVDRGFDLDTLARLLDVLEERA